LPKRAATIPLAAYLLLHREQQISRNTLAPTLWADAITLPPAPSGEPWIRADGDMLRWHFDDAMRLDVADFERLSADPGSCADAVDMYAGDLLADSYDDRVVSYRERLRALYFNDLSTLIGRYRDDRKNLNLLTQVGKDVKIEIRRAPARAARGHVEVHVPTYAADRKR
jgi:hypothetical protein